MGEEEMTDHKATRKRIRAAIESGGNRFRWPLCETCGHGKSCHAPDGDGWRCHFHGKKRNGERCDCMRYRGELEITSR
jgi:hypothetical protein